jgi:hypothetical protein
MTSLGCELRVHAIPKRLHTTPGNQTHLEIALIVTEDAAGTTNESAKRCCGGYARGYVSSNDTAPQLRTAVDLWNHRDDIDSPDLLDAARVDRSACRHAHPLFLPRPGRYTAAWYLLYVGFQGMFDHLHDRVVQPVLSHTHFHAPPALFRHPATPRAPRPAPASPPPPSPPGHWSDEEWVDPSPPPVSDAALLAGLGRVLLIGSSRPRTLFYDLAAMEDGGGGGGGGGAPRRAHEDLAAGRFAFRWDDCEADLGGAPFGPLDPAAAASAAAAERWLDAEGACLPRGGGGGGGGVQPPPDAVVYTPGACWSARALAPGAAAAAGAAAGAVLRALAARCAARGHAVLVATEMAAHPPHAWAMRRAGGISLCAGSFNPQRLLAVSRRAAAAAAAAGLPVVDLHPLSAAYHPNTGAEPFAHYYAAPPAPPHAGNAASRAAARAVLRAAARAVAAAAAAGSGGGGGGGTA